MSELSDRLFRVALDGFVSDDDPHVIADAQGKIASLTAEVATLKQENEALLTQALGVEAERDIALAQVERLIAALEPFAEQMKRFDESQAMDSAPVGWGGLTIGDLRRARAALQSTEGDGG